MDHTERSPHEKTDRHPAFMSVRRPPSGGGTRFADPLGAFPGGCHRDASGEAL